MGPTNVVWVGIKTLAMVAIWLAASVLSTSAMAQDEREDGPVVKTAEGPVRGFVEDGVSRFLAFPTPPPDGRASLAAAPSAGGAEADAAGDGLRPHVRANQYTRGVRCAKRQRGLPVPQRFRTGGEEGAGAPGIASGHGLDPRRRKFRRREQRL